MQAGAKRTKPIGSRRLMISKSVGGLRGFDLLSGMRTNVKTASATAPGGRLI